VPGSMNPNRRYKFKNKVKNKVKNKLKNKLKNKVRVKINGAQLELAASTSKANSTTPA
jgi:hypothetical protein